MKRILFFVHYNKLNCLADYVIYLLHNIKHIYNKIIFISNSPIQKDDLIKIEGLYDDIIFRENKGYDFGAWKDAIFHEGWENLFTYDNVTLMNDSCFGPLFDLENIYNQMEQKNINLWGLTDHPSTDSGMPGTNKAIPWHIQSYFLCFNNELVKSKTFMNFWKIVNYEKNIYTVIQKYETKITKIFNNAGFKCVSFLAADPKQINISFMAPDICITNSVPFLKIKSFFNFSDPDYIYQFIQANTKYPCSLITDFFSDMYEPSVSLITGNKTFSVNPLLTNQQSSVPFKIAIHLHIFYVDVFKYYVTILDELSVKYHLFITTDTQDKKQIILDYLVDHNTGNNLKGIFVFPNHGRDILPWLNISNKINSYDIVGHFYTKKSPSVSPHIGISWQKELLDLLLVPINNIVEIFNSNKKIGVVIPDIPYYFHLSSYNISRNNSLNISMNNIWKEMNCKKKIDFKEISTLISPYGNMFWYRPAALCPLFDFQVENLKIPHEPLANETILNYLERILLYIAWSQGYDFRISTYSFPQLCTFYYMNKLSNINKDLYNDVLKSKNYKVGYIILFLPRLAKRILYRILKRI